MSRGLVHAERLWHLWMGLSEMKICQGKRSRKKIWSLSKILIKRVLVALPLLSLLERIETFLKDAFKIKTRRMKSGTARCTKFTMTNKSNLLKRTNNRLYLINWQETNLQTQFCTAVRSQITKQKSNSSQKLVASSQRLTTGVVRPTAWPSTTLQKPSKWWRWTWILCSCQYLMTQASLNCLQTTTLIK